MAYALVMGFIGSKTSTIGQALQIQSYTPGINEHELIIYVQNVGQGAINIQQRDGVYVYDEGFTIVSDVAVGEGQTVPLTVDLDVGQQRAPKTCLMCLI